MSNENKNRPQLTERGEKLKKRTRIAVTYLGGAATVLAISAGIGEHVSPDLNVVNTKTEQLGPGETVWDIAGKANGGEQTRKVVDWIEDHSPDLDDGAHAGDTIVVPVIDKKE